MKRYTIIRYRNYAVNAGNREEFCSFVGDYVQACLFGYQLEKTADLYGSYFRPERMA